MSDVKKFRISLISNDDISGMGRPINFVFDSVVNSEQTTSASSLCKLLVTENTPASHYSVLKNIIWQLMPTELVI